MSGYGMKPSLGPLFEPRFNGADYVPKLDHARLTKQIAAVHAAIADGKERTLSQIATRSGCGEASASAQLRNLRKPRFGGHKIERRRDGNVWLYRLVVKP